MEIDSVEETPSRPMQRRHRLATSSGWHVAIFDRPSPLGYLAVMVRVHPDKDQIRLENVLAALGNPMRLTVVRVLAGGGEHNCSSVLSGVGKSTLTHHWKVLRDSGVIWQTPSGRENLLQLRRADLESRFPGLLASVLHSVENDVVTKSATDFYLPGKATASVRG